MSSPRRSTAKRTSTKEPETPVTEIDVYGSFTRCKSKTAPKWHSIKKMRYVFWRMMNGATVTDAINEIHWHSFAFWTILDRTSDDEGTTPFRFEYNAAKSLQARAMADSVVIVAEGRDHISRRQHRRINRIVERAFRRLKGTKSREGRKIALASMLSDLREHDKIVMSRNKLQMEAAKWLAAKLNPNEFAEKSSLGVSGLPHAGEGERTSAIAISFIGPDGKEVPFEPVMPDTETPQ